MLLSRYVDLALQSQSNTVSYNIMPVSSSKTISDIHRASPEGLALTSCYPISEPLSNIEQHPHPGVAHTCNFKLRTLGVRSQHSSDPAYFHFRHKSVCLVEASLD